MYCNRLGVSWGHVKLIVDEHILFMSSYDKNMNIGYRLYIDSHKKNIVERHSRFKNKQVHVVQRWLHQSGDKQHECSKSFLSLCVPALPPRRHHL